MAVASRARAELLRHHWRVREMSPERAKVWTEHQPRKVPVVYYLSRGGHLEHPHFIEVTVAPGEGLHLRDVINRLNDLRGKGMGNAYAWSCKRSYKNGFVWQDLTENDLIHPTIVREYVLKGSERLNSASSPSSQDTAAASTASFSSTATVNLSSSTSESSRTSRDVVEIQKSRRKKIANSFELNEYKVYKGDFTVDAASKAMDASTQTDDRGNPRPTMVPEDDCVISRSTSSSSPQTLESLIKADCRKTYGSGAVRTNVAGATEDSGVGGGRVRASALLLHLISCGSINAKGGHGVFASVVPHFRGVRLLPHRSSDSKEVGYSTESISDGVLNLEEKEYFSASLFDTKNKGARGDDSIVDVFSGLKKSSSYNADMYR